MYKDFDSWNQIKKRVNESNHTKVKLGEVFWCKLGLNIGVEQDGRNDFERPVVIIKKFSSQIVLIAPLTTKFHAGNWYLKVNFLNRNQQIILNQIKPIDTRRLLNSIGQILKKEVKEIVRKYIELIII